MLATARQAIATTLQSRFPDMQCSAYVTANPTPPCCWVYPSGTSYDLAMGRGADMWTFIVQAIVGDSLSEAAQIQLDALLEPSGQTSMKEALEVSVTLSGLVFDISAKTNNGFQRYQRDANIVWVGSEWTVEVFASGVGGA